MSDKNFDLLIERKDNLFSVQVLNSPAGKTKSRSFKLPFSIKKWERFRSQIPYEVIRERLKKNNQSLNPNDLKQEVERLEQELQEYGSKLFDVIFTGRVDVRFRESLNLVNNLRLQLHLTDPELNKLPWECLYDYRANDKEFLSLLGKTSLVRYFKIPSLLKPLKVTLPLKVLVVVFNSENIDYENELTVLRQAVKKLGRNIELTELILPTLRDFTTKFREHKYHILHLIGHGDFNKNEEKGVLIFKDQEGSYSVNKRLIRVLRNSNLRLVFINACKSGVASSKDVFAGIAQRLMTCGISAVIAMQFSITDNSAIALTEGFYKTLIKEGCVDAALFEARIIVQANKEPNLEWAIPVLFTSSPNGQLFNIKEPIDRYYDSIIDKLKEGSVVPVLGLDINSLLRKQPIQWRLGQDHLPNYIELIDHLRNNKNNVRNINYDNLAKIAQQFLIDERENDLKKKLYRLYNGRNYLPTKLHEFLASLPKQLGKKNTKVKYPIILTMNYDDIFIEAFRNIEQDFDLLYLKSTEDYQSKFCHRRFNKNVSKNIIEEQPSEIIETHNEYPDLEVYKRPIIININGMIIRGSQSESTFIITEDNYIRYGIIEPAKLLPSQIVAELRDSNFLFMGMCFSDWCVRHFFLNLWNRDSPNNVSWAVQETIDVKEERFWNKYGVDIIDLPLDQFITNLDSLLL